MQLSFKNFTVITFIAAFFILLIFFRGTYGSYEGDDAEYYRDIYDRPTIADIWSFSKQTTHQGKTNYYSPILIVIFTVIFKVFDGNIHAFHFFDAIIHFLNGLMIYILWQDKLKYRILLLLFCLVFIFHPKQIETMQFISAFAHLLSLQALLLTLLVFKNYLQTGKNFFYGLSIAMSALCYLTYLTTYPLFIILFLAFFIFLPHFPISWANIIKAFRLVIPHMLCLIPFFAISTWKFPQSQIVKAWGGATLSDHTLVRALDIMSLFFIPGRISSEAREVLMVTIYIVYVCLLVWAIKREHREALFGLIWTAIFSTLLSISNFRPADTVVRYFYISCAGVGMALCSYINWYLEKAVQAFKKEKTP